MVVMSEYLYFRIWVRCESVHQLWLCQHMVISAVVMSAYFHVKMFVMSANIVMSEECLIRVLRPDSMALHVHPESLSRVCHERVTILASMWPLVLCFLASAFIVKAFV